MAKYEIVHRCNHKETVTLFGPGKDRERKIEWLSSLSCPACLSIDRITAASAIHELQEAAGLPRLVGSEKQIAWGVQVRQDFLIAWKKIENKLTESALSDDPTAPLAEQLLFEGDAFVAGPLTHSDAKYWIDNRDEFTESAIQRHLFEIRHKIADEAKAIVGVNLPITDNEKRDVIRLAIEQRKARLEERRETAAEIRTKAIVQTVNAEEDKQKKLWMRKDRTAQMIRAALGNTIEATVKIWYKEKEKRVYLNWGNNNSACLYVTGNQRQRPGLLEAPKSIENKALAEALKQVSADWANVSFTISADGKAK